MHRLRCTRTSADSWHVHGRDDEHMPVVVDPEELDDTGGLADVPDGSGAAPAAITDDGDVQAPGFVNMMDAFEGDSDDDDIQPKNAKNSKKKTSTAGDEPHAPLPLEDDIARALGFGPGEIEVEDDYLTEIFNMLKQDGDDAAAAAAQEDNRGTQCHNKLFSYCFILPPKKYKNISGISAFIVPPDRRLRMMM